LKYPNFSAKSLNTLMHLSHPCTMHYSDKVETAVHEWLWTQKRLTSKTTEFLNLCHSFVSFFFTFMVLFSNSENKFK
jgi:hypothetical protein